MVLIGHGASAGCREARIIRESPVGPVGPRPTARTQPVATEMGHVVGFVGHWVCTAVQEVSTGGHWVATGGQYVAALAATMTQVVSTGGQ